MSHSEVVTLTIADRVATVMLNRPQRLNALTRELMITLAEVLAHCTEAPEVRALLITGAGKAFCAGQDLSERDPRTLTGPLDLEAIQKDLYHPVVTLLATMEKPVVVALNGLAAGAGASLALAGDMVIGAKSARLLFSFAKVGLSVDAGGGRRLVEALGPARAKGLLMTGGELSAEEAARAGLIWQCVEDEQLATVAGDLAASLARGPATTLSAIKQAVAAAGETDSLAAYLAAEARLQGMAGAAPDYAEGVLSFLEKRKPRFL